MELLAERENALDGAAPRIAGGARWRIRIGRILTGAAVLFLTVDAVLKLLELPPVVEGSAKLGYPPSTVFGMGAVLLACVVTHVIPRTAVLGAVLLTGYLGGAIATHVRVGDPFLTHTLFPVYVAALIWGGLHLRDGSRLAAAVPWRPRA